MKQFTDEIPLGVQFRGPMPSPIIIPNHIDGPVLVFSDGQMHWLSIAERLMVRFGMHDADSLQATLRPNLTKLLTQTSPPPYTSPCSTPAL